MDNGASSYRRYLNGDEDAFRQIVSEYFDPLVFFIDRYVSDAYASEDIAIDVFAYVAANPYRYHFGTTLKTYLFMLGRSRALDHLRRRKRQAEVPLTEAAALPSDAPALEEQLLQDGRKLAIHQAISQLSEEMQLVVHLTYFEDMQADEVARVLKKNRKQIYNLLYRAKNALRTILGEAEVL